jgi:DNA-binding HxlR family transcriptional regulator
MQKITIATKFDALADYIQNGENSIFPTPEDAIEFINDRKEKAVKKAGSRKPTATQKANEGIKAVILDNLTAEGITVTEMMQNIPDLAGYSNQKLSAILRQMVLDGSVVKTVDKKKSYFSLA